MLYVKAKHGAIHKRVCLLLSLEGRARTMDDAVKTLCDDRLMSVVDITSPLLQDILCPLRSVGK